MPRLVGASAGDRDADRDSLDFRANPTVYRGPNWPAQVGWCARATFVYAGVLGTLWLAGFPIGTPGAWALAFAPLVVWLAIRLASSARIAVIVEGDSVRFEGASTRSDFEIAVGEITEVYRDPTLPGRPLALVTRDGDERVCIGLGSAARDALNADLQARLGLQNVSETP